MANTETIAKLLIALEADVKGLKKDVATSQKTFKQFSTGVTTQVNKMKQSWLGFTAVVAGSAFAFKRLFGVWSGFSQRMAEVNTLLGLQAAEYGKLKNAILDMTKIVPQTADELGAAQYDIVSAGIQDAAESLVVLEQSAKAAVAGLTNAKVAAKTGLSVINAYGQETSELADVYDILFQTIKEGVTTFPELSQSIGQILPIAKAANEDFETMAAALAAMTKVGLSTPEATTALSRSLQSLAAPTDQAKATMKKLGIEWEGFIPTLTKLAEVLRGIPDDEKLAVISKIIPNIRAAKGVLALANNMNTLNETIDAMADRSGAMEKAYDIMALTPENRVKAFTNALTRLTNKVMEFAGVAFLDELKSIQLQIDAFIVSGGARKLGEQFAVLVKWVTRFVNFLVKNWKTVVSFAIGAKLLGIANSVAQLTMAITSLNAALLTNPYTAAAAAILALGAAFLQADANAKKFKETLQKTIPDEVNNRLKEYLVELESLYAQQAAALPEFKAQLITYEEYNELLDKINPRIKELETNLGGDFGIEFTGSPESKIEQLNKRLNELLEVKEAFEGKPTPTKTPTPTPTGKPAGTSGIELALIASEAALKEFKARIKNELFALETMYKQSNLTISEYYSDREEFIRQIGQKELALVRQAIKATSEEKDLIKLRSQEKLIELDIENQLMQLYQEKAKALSDVNDQQAQAQAIIAEAEKRTLFETPSLQKSAFAIGLEAEMQELEDKHAAELLAFKELEHSKAEIDKLAKAQKLEREQLAEQQTEAIYENNLKNAIAMTSGISDLFMDMYNSIGKEASAFFFLSRAIAAANTIVSTQAAAMKAYQQGGIYGGAQAVLIAAQGGIALGKILATTIQGFASGGLVTHGTHGTADDVPAWLSKGEHVTKKSAVDYYGTGFMNAINNKTFPKSMLAGMNFSAAPSISKSGYQSGGVAVPSAVSQTQDLQIVNLTDRKAFDSYLSSNSGKRTILNVISDNSYEVRRLLRS